MSDKPQPDLAICCRCAVAGVLPEAVCRLALEKLAGLGARLLAASDLCELAANRDGRLAEIAGARHVLVAACHPRAVRWLLAWAGVPPDDARATFLDLRAEKAMERVSALPASAPGQDPPNTDAPRPATKKWAAWFPVIDYSRCTNCRQCVSFCLFGVYALDEGGQVRVVNPRNCKNNCPACARTCPSQAILFPKYHAGPINGGDDVEEGAAEQLLRQDAARAVGQGVDVYAALRARAKEAKR